MKMHIRDKHASSASQKTNQSPYMLSPIIPITDRRQHIRSYYERQTKSEVQKSSFNAANEYTINDHPVKTPIHPEPVHNQMYEQCIKMDSPDEWESKKCNVRTHVVPSVNIQWRKPVILPPISKTKTSTKRRGKLEQARTSAIKPLRFKIYNRPAGEGPLNKHTINKSITIPLADTLSSKSEQKPYSYKLKEDMEKSVSIASERKPTVQSVHKTIAYDYLSTCTSNILDGKWLRSPIKFSNRIKKTEASTSPREKRKHKTNNSRAIHYRAAAGTRVTEDKAKELPDDRNASIENAPAGTGHIETKTHETIKANDPETDHGQYSGQDNVPFESENIGVDLENRITVPITETQYKKIDGIRPITPKVLREPLPQSTWYDLEEPKDIVKFWQRHRLEYLIESELHKACTNKNNGEDFSDDEDRESLNEEQYEEYGARIETLAKQFDVIVRRSLEDRMENGLYCTTGKANGLS